VKISELGTPPPPVDAVQVRCDRQPGEDRTRLPTVVSATAPARLRRAAAAGLSA
jgi:hypothetical protein